METMTTEQRQARIQALESELAHLRAEDAADPAAAEKFLESAWAELGLDRLMSKEDFKLLLAKCRMLKQDSCVLAAQHFSAQTQLAMAQAIPVINRL